MRLVLSACILAVLGLNGCGGGGSSPPPPPPPQPVVTIPDMGAYLATSRCADGRLAVLAGCAGAPQRASDPMLWRRADASGHTDGQIEDAFASDDGRYYVASFSYPPNGPFDAAHGDGGDVLVIDGGAARIDYTRPLSNNPVTEGYWAGAGCQPPLGMGWLAFDQYAPTGAWRSAVAWLAPSLTRGACPPLVPAYTRWRMETAAVPFTVIGAPQSVTLPIIVSEHYTGITISAPGAMERFIFGRGVGRIVWEAWATSPPPIPGSWACDGISPWNGAPAAGWYLQDRRCWTAIVPGNGMTGAQWGWPGAGFAP